LADKLERVNQLNLEIAQLGRKFSENVMNKPGFVDVYPASRVPRNLRHHFKSVYRFNCGSFEKQSNQMSTAKQKGLRIVTDSENLSSALRWISDEEVSMSCSTCKTSGTFIDPFLYVTDKDAL
jgi:intermediate peptidase